MSATSSVTFGELRRLLVALGFVAKKRREGWTFEHPPSQTWFMYRPYRSREKVACGDLHMTRKQLDWREVLSEQAFDDRLKKATA